MLAVFVALSAVAADFLDFALRPMLARSSDMVQIAAGAPASQALAPLIQADPRSHAREYWLVLSRLMGAGRHLQAGVYAVREGDTPVALLDRFRRGEVIERSLTVPEGWTFRQAIAALQSDPYIRTTLSASAPAEWAHVMESGGDSPEGWFFPDTYHYGAGTSDVLVAKRAYTQMRQLLEQEWTTRDADLPFETPYQALIMASIVEKETGRADERPRIAAVFIGRLRRGMRLETDPTVIYGLGVGYDGDIRIKDLRTDTPYNTYTRAGLPPTPIALPGRQAIHATLHPAADDALYFVARGDGSHEFSRTYEEHRAAVIRYQLHGDDSRYPAAAATKENAP